MLQAKFKKLKIKKKKIQCYELMHRLGRGVYLDSLRIVLGPSHYLQAVSTKLSCFLPGIHACKYFIFVSKILNHVFIRIKKAENWQHKINHRLLLGNVYFSYWMWLAFFHMIFHRRAQKFFKKKLLVYIDRLISEVWPNEIKPGPP